METLFLKACCYTCIVSQVDGKKLGDSSFDATSSLVPDMENQRELEDC
jgi:hypothetical protein